MRAGQQAFVRREQRSIAVDVDGAALQDDPARFIAVESGRFPRAHPAPSRDAATGVFVVTVVVVARPAVEAELHRGDLALAPDEERNEIAGPGPVRLRVKELD